MSGVGLPALLTLPRLRRLDLGGTDVSDRGFPVLAQLTTLRTLDLTGTNVTRDTAEELGERLPECTVVR